MILGTGSIRKVVKMKFMVVYSPTSYNIIFGRLALNRLWAVVSTTHLCMKYPVDNLVGVIRANRYTVRRCYDESTCVLEDKRGKHIVLDKQTRDTRLQLDEDLKEIQVGLELHQRTKIGAYLDPGMEEEVVRRHICMDPADMPSIDPDFLCHHLSISLGAR
ncbi:hypothetical protein CR513_40882, partial [Mucuna pruriens]